MAIAMDNMSLRVLWIVTMTRLGNGLSILSFGGSGNIGSEVLTQLIPESHDITLVSRGNWYFDSSQRILPHVNFIPCDRFTNCGVPWGDCKALQRCTEFMDFIKERHFDIVFDFSAYQPQVIRNALDVLNGKVGVYVYVSTDSVYEVSKEKQHDGPFLESDAVRPTDPEERERLAKEDSYGHNKLAGEEVLEQAYRNGTGPKYIIFRLPDVLGPRDTTERLWLYHLWIKYYHTIEKPIYVPPHVKDLETSMVYVKDVGQAFRKAVEKSDTLVNSIYNLGSSEDFNLSRFLRQYASILNVSDVEEDNEDSEDSFVSFPSVLRGSVDISKAKEELGFEPTPWKEAMQETVAFYEEGFYKFPEDRQEIVDVLVEHVVPKERLQAFQAALDADLASFPPTQGMKEEL